MLSLGFGSLVLLSATFATHVTSQAPLVLDFEGQHSSTSGYGLARLAKRAQPISAQLDNDIIQYLVNVSLGTPPQPLSFSLATNAGDLLVISTQNPYCQNPNNYCEGGYFNQNTSSSYKVVSQNFSTSYSDGTNATGVYATDSMTIGGINVDNVQFGLEQAGSNNVNVMGIGYPDLEETNVQSNTRYANLPIRLFNQGLTNIIGYSIYYNDHNTLRGRVAFGGIDTGKYYGNFANLQIATNNLKYGYTTVPLDSVGIQSNNGQKPIAGSSLNVNPDSSATLIELPPSIVSQIQDFTQFESATNGWLIKEFSRIDNSTLLNFTFGTTVISVRMPNLLVNWNGTHSALLLKSSTSAPYTLGIAFFRNAYTVYDFTHNQLSIAPLNTNGTAQNITAIPAAGVAGIQGLSLASQPAANSTNGTTSGGNNNNNNNNGGGGLSTGAKIGIGLGVGLGVPILIALIAAIIIIPRRRHRKENAAAATTHTQPAMTSNTGTGAAPAAYHDQGYNANNYSGKAELAPTEYGNGSNGYGTGYPQNNKYNSMISTDGHRTSELGGSEAGTLYNSSQGLGSPQFSPNPNSGVQSIGRKPVAPPQELPASMPMPENEPRSPAMGHLSSAGGSDVGRSAVSPTLGSSTVVSRNSAYESNMR